MAKRKRERLEAHPIFQEYTEFISRHPNYAGMPDLRFEDGSIQWEAPSNRLSGQFKDTHKRRLGWWKVKAESLGLDTSKTSWISNCAKIIHPTRKKPCKHCGRVMDIHYIYPSKILASRISSLPFVSKSFVVDPLEDIETLLRRLHSSFGDRILGTLPFLLKAKSISFPEGLKTLDEWIAWINQTYVEFEPSTLSPGAMSNAPDRLDGFHSFNRCCREKVDKGRSVENLRSYTTDRRTFEFWVGGDWIAADRVMGWVRSHSQGKELVCANGHFRPVSADHVGPVSLGFNHRPSFRLLCDECNSARGNRMTLDDVTFLMQAEKLGEEVVSWYAKPIWDARKKSVIDDETAGRLSKMLRDNRHLSIGFLADLTNQKFYTFLCSLLSLNYANFDFEFSTIAVRNHVVYPVGGKALKRETMYAGEQKVRRMRVAFSSLLEYVQKEQRNASVAQSEDSKVDLTSVTSVLAHESVDARRLDQLIDEALRNGKEDALRDLLPSIEKLIKNDPVFGEARKKLIAIMQEIASVLSKQWDSDRYVRDVEYE